MILSFASLLFLAAPVLHRENGPELDLNGTSLNGTSLNGVSLNGKSLNGIVANALAANKLGLNGGYATAETPIVRVRSITFADGASVGVRP